MSKNSHFRGPFDKQHGKRAQALLKSASQQLYQIHWSLPSQLSWKRSLFLTCQILGLLLNTLTGDEKYPRLKIDTLMIPIQMQLSQKQKSFSQFFPTFLKSTLISKYFHKKMTLIDFVISKLRTPKTRSDKCLKSPVPEDPSASNMVNVPKRCWNLHHSTFILFIDHCEVKWVGKSLSYSHPNLGTAC